MAIETEVTLQPDYTCCMRVIGKQSRIAEIARFSTLVVLTFVRNVASLVVDAHFFTRVQFGHHAGLSWASFLGRDIKVPQAPFLKLFTHVVSELLQHIFNILTNYYRVCE